MLKLLLGLALLEASSGSRLGKIFGGMTTSISEHSFLVNLRRSGGFRCGGALISPTCVLTAAHCLERRHHQLHDLTIHAQQQCLGDQSSSDHMRHAWYAAVSPYYRPDQGLDSDVAVIRLRHSFDISSNASLVKIDYNDLPERTNLTVMGWGKIDSHGHNWNQCLQAAKVQLIPQKQCCETVGSPKQWVTQNMFCALGENAKDACQGDSGGPVINDDGRTVGIVSWGYGCGSGYPGVYTRLGTPSITYWLKSFVERHCW
ncbi:trypsin alpha [Drosophila serrata]|uniref:trypsin alpha n=1 Tax=Drosophila serrata TaxID=7274 RepID=UPI000A1CFBBB|nr:trypsin alpha [Drosophila serrata]